MVHSHLSTSVNSPLSAPVRGCGAGRALDRSKLDSLPTLTMDGIETVSIESFGNNGPSTPVTSSPSFTKTDSLTTDQLFRTFLWDLGEEIVEDSTSYHDDTEEDPPSWSETDAFWHGLGEAVFNLAQTPGVNKLALEEVARRIGEKHQVLPKDFATKSHTDKQSHPQSSDTMVIPDVYHSLMYLDGTPSDCGSNPVHDYGNTSNPVELTSDMNAVGAHTRPSNQWFEDESWAWYLCSMQWMTFYSPDDQSLSQLREQATSPDTSGSEWLHTPSPTPSPTLITNPRSGSGMIRPESFTTPDSVVWQFHTRRHALVDPSFPDTLSHPVKANPVKSFDDMYTPRWTRGLRQHKEGLCPICQALGERRWFRMKVSAYWYHMNFFHGISSSTCRPYLPPQAIRTLRPDQYHYAEEIQKDTVFSMNQDYSKDAMSSCTFIPADKENTPPFFWSEEQGKPVTNLHYKAELNWKPQVWEGLCHQCQEWVPLNSVRDVSVNVPEIYWWKHAQKCHTWRKRFAA